MASRGSAMPPSTHHGLISDHDTLAMGVAQERQRIVVFVGSWRRSLALMPCQLVNDVPRYHCSEELDGHVVEKVAIDRIYRDPVRMAAPSPAEREAGFAYLRQQLVVLKRSAPVRPS
jgi:hypothetical protein